MNFQQHTPHDPIETSAEMIAYFFENFVKPEKSDEANVVLGAILRQFGQSLVDDIKSKL